MGDVVLSYKDADGNHSVALEREVMTLGRSSDRDVVLGDPCISRLHASIVREGETCTLVDEKSTHGTYLNGERVERAVLRGGDVVQLGSVNGPRLHVQMGDAGKTEMIATGSLFSDLLTSLSEIEPSQGASVAGAREMEKLNWLLRAARKLNEGGGIEEVLAAFLQLTLQLTGLERAFVFLQEDERMRLALGLGSDGRALVEDSTVSRNAMRRAIESELKFSISDTLSDETAGEWASVMANQIRSICCIPLRKRTAAEDDESSRLLGLVYLDSRVGRKDLSTVDHQLLDTIAAEASSLLQNAILAEADYEARQAREELAVAAKIHSGLMAMTMPKLPYAEIDAKTVPCLAIGGDFYDVVALDDCVYVTITDVSGKGVSAAIVAATLQGIIHSQFLAGRGLGEIAHVLNHFLCTRNVGKYATTILLRLFSDGRLEYMNCGHVLPLAVRGAEVTHLEEGNLIVGLIPVATYESATLTMQPGDRLLLTTDGLTEAEDSEGNQFGEAGLNGEACCEGVAAILARVEKFQAPNLAQDDCTLVEIRYTGAATGIASGAGTGAAA